MRRNLLSASLVVLVLSALASGEDAASRKSPLGRKIENFALKDSLGKSYALADFKEKPLLVVAFLGAECPLVKLYASRLAEIETEYAKFGVAVIGVNSNQHDSLTEVAHFAKHHKLNFPLLKDPKNEIADAFGAERTPEVFVLDAERKIRYFGRIDDQYHYGVQRKGAESNYLTNALDALVAGKEVAAPHVEAIGCYIGRIAEPDESSDITYSNQIARIFQKRCVECHREGEIAPFALTNYDEVVGWAETIDEVVREQRMPPWHANPAHGSFKNDARLTDDEKKTIYAWVAAGAPKGDEKQLPPPREFVTGWRIGEPDQIVKMAAEPFHVPATGELKYKYYFVDPGWKEDRYIQAAEARAGNRGVVHHILIAHTGKAIERLNHGIDSDWITAMAPGSDPLILPEGMAKYVPAGSKIIFQMHYTPNGTEAEDLSYVGFKFVDKAKVKHVVATQKAATRRLNIPPGAENHRVDAEFAFRKDSLMLAMFPHMHLRGKAFRYTAIYPDGKEEILLDVPHYDFNWQNAYVLPEPKRMPKGTRIHCVAHFDNSEKNLANPNPKATVRWGDQTWEEMMIGYFDACYEE